MDRRLLNQIREYKLMIINEHYDSIIYEMINDLKSDLLKSSTDISFNYEILETFYNINVNNVIDRLNHLEDILTENTISVSKIKSSFLNKHERILQRDKSWLNKNKKKISGLNFEEIEIEVPSDYKVTFEQLLNRHGIFDKAFTNQNDGGSLDDKLRRFEDKKGDLKNGLDNYLRTGTSRREIGMRKLKGEDARFAIDNMIAYCESFLAGKQYLEEKMNNIIVSISDNSVKESTSPIETLKILLEKDNSLKEIEDTSQELDNLSTKNKKSDKPVEKDQNNNDDQKSTKNQSAEQAADDLVDEESIPEPKNNKQEVNKDKSAEQAADDLIDEESIPESDKEQGANNEESKQTRGIEDRQLGVAVLLSIAEERYFDYINILKGLITE